MPRREKHGSKRGEKVSRAIYPFGVSGDFEREWKSSKAFDIMLRVPAETPPSKHPLLSLRYIHIYTQHKAQPTREHRSLNMSIPPQQLSVEPASRTQSDFLWRIEHLILSVGPAGQPLFLGALRI